jgi:hypothetical protein
VPAALADRQGRPWLPACAGATREAIWEQELSHELSQWRLAASTVSGPGQDWKAAAAYGSPTKRRL